jgi:hypothetical protein
MRMKMQSALLLSISVLAVAACSGGGSSSATMEPKTAAPTPPAALSDVSGLTEADTLTPADIEAATQETTLLSPISVQTDSSDENNVLKARIMKLEDTVNSLRRDYDRIMPAFASLNTTNERIQSLLDEIEQQGGLNVSAKKTAVTEPMSKPVQPFKADTVALAAPTTLIPETKTTAISTTVTHDDMGAGVLSPPGSVSRASPELNAPLPAIHMPVTKVVETKVEVGTTDASPVTVTGAAKAVRIGEHGNKTRLVIDLAGNTKPDVTYDLDNTEKVLLIEMPETAWGGTKSGSAKASAFVNGWSVEDSENGGANLVVQLKKGAKILSTEYLSSNGKDSARLVIDLGPAA